MAGTLILVRHQESQWTKLGLWTGTRDESLTELGFAESREIGKLLSDMKIDRAYASMQVRSIETLSCILGEFEQYQVPSEHTAALNERDYGDYTGKNKQEMEKLLGEEEYLKVHRSWNYPVPNGESLKMVFDRVVPFFTGTVLPHLSRGETVLIVAHGNSLRALMKYIEQLSDTAIENIEMKFGTALLYEVDREGFVVKKEVRITASEQPSTYEKAQTIATIGPASGSKDVLRAMAEQGLGLARLNFSWGDIESRVAQIRSLHEIEKEIGRTIPVIVDVPGPRVQEGAEHTYSSQDMELTDTDRSALEFAVAHHIAYVAVSFVGGSADVQRYRDALQKLGGTQKIIAKIERAVALDSLDEIIAASDALMVARGDLGNEVPLERIPFIQSDIIARCKKEKKPVITATQMLLSMVHEASPTRAEVTDVTNAVLEGSDAVMLSEETAVGAHPVEAVAMMEKIILEAGRHTKGTLSLNPL